MPGMFVGSLMNSQLRILLLEDSPTDVELLERALRRARMEFELHVVDTKKEFIAGLQAEKLPDVIISDHSLPSFNSLDAMRIMQEMALDIPFILVTGSVSEDFAVRCIKAGADDYILKDSLIRLPSAIESSLAKKQLSREKKMIEALHERLQSAYREIADMHRDMKDSIVYARHIQEAMLPPKGKLATYVNDAFIIHKPKDILSGDFYWFAQLDEKLLVAAVDCTGHGVPGALMSMVGNYMLNEIVRERKVTTPGDVLAQLNTGIRKFLKQDQEGTTAPEGMDIALCAIDTRAHTVEYAGANNHLFFFRGKELQLVKGDRKGIGGFHLPGEITYTTRQFSYTPGDTFFLFSDGYADQFGGKDERRMQTRNLVKLLQSTLTLGLKEQEKLLDDWFERWKGGREQTDDILLIGVKL